jgi:uncharacterized delta-60 repeat protein
LSPWRKILLQRVPGVKGEGGEAMKRWKEVKWWTPLILVLSLALLARCGGGGSGGDGSIDSPGKPWAVTIQGVIAVGTGSDDTGRGIATDNAGNVYVAGITDGTLPGSPVTNQGAYDLFLVKYNSTGDNVWTRQMGSANNDTVSGVAVDSGGNIYVAGRTGDTLPGSPTTYQGGNDIFLVKYNTTGDNVWTRQMGSPDSDTVSGVAVDSEGNIYVAGFTGGTLPGSPTTHRGGGFDLFLVKYNSTGDNVWTRQMGSPNSDTVSGVAADSEGNIYVAGYTLGTLPGSPTKNQGGSDLFLVKYNSTGDSVWTRQMGSPFNDTVSGVAVDTTGIYVAGYTSSTLPGSPTTNQGSDDLFLVKYNSAGDNAWTRQFGTSDIDDAMAVVVDSGGNIYMAGFTLGTLPGSPTTNQGGSDLFLVKYNSAGDNVWTRQKGSPDADDADNAMAVAVDTAGNVYVTGVRVKVFIEGDGFVLKYLPDGTGP